jgi:hypothetical protein
MNDKYQGWTNYETWAVKLWIDNEQGIYMYWNDRTDEVIEAVARGEGNKFAGTDEDRQRIMLAELLKDEYEHDAEQWMGDQSSVFADLMNAALGSVNWYEIAESLLEHARERAGDAE